MVWSLRIGHRRFVLSPGANSVGRDPNSTVCINDASVSRGHARITITGTDVFIEDLQSKNGTFLAGEPVTTAVPLTDGDEIGVGSIVLRFRMRSRSTATWSNQSARQRRRPVEHDGDT